MRVGTPGFIPDRLAEARQARRIGSKSELARILGVAPSTVTRWEDGTSAPDAEALGLLSGTLKVRRDFFLRPSFSPSRPLFHRSLVSTLVSDLAYQHSQMNWLHEISHLVQHYVDLPNVDLPDVLGGAHYKQLRDDDLERIAVDLRRYWQIGEGPCPDMVALLERIGIVVGTIEMGTSKLDGLCSWSLSEDRPHILLATDKMCYPRRQMDAAHEMAHALLHRGVSREELRDNLKFIETQAFRLASAFLMPSTTYPYEVSRPSLASLLALKERWRVSIKAQIRRLSDMKMIPSEHMLQMYKLYSAKGWTSEEPLDKQWSVSKPRLLHDSLELIVDSGTRTKADLLSVEFTMSAGDVERLASLPPGWFSSKEGEVVQLKPRTKISGSGADGVVIPFKRNS
ncbi:MULTISPECIES: ImmA/IrrE family metallo-endopeptidase [Asticcacaulis]|uniref:helix-turn-helix domain-containing protein n=1 Tax=Asticcacaulis TaxID=76890 RepID=UPI001AE418E9|nr:MULTISPECIES: XRE family transcriptional regulator [Asticcacaulis]MBP2160283.1 Zn-dependent peptidase ImmA (M78 family)/transcriptional regulator with XRE-family HTH domain [Asticcacaulis solisilvae]MDR6801414.1 Zn-dependent peptidase ImmA (M78 family)/transcriptional regulator with XRE-family HTH domain [Asticcacaulis sp. BE141]